MRSFIFVLLGNFISILTFSQIGIGTITPNASAQLDVSSSNKGFLPPRLTTFERNAIANPAAGLVVFNTTTKNIEFYSGTAWVELNGNYWLKDVNGMHATYPKVGIGINADSYYPLYVHQPHYNGQSIAMFESSDLWHASVGIRNTTVNRQYTFCVGGVNNAETGPTNFSLLNNTLIRSALAVSGNTNYIGIGIPTHVVPSIRSTLHVFTGDINIEQIGSGIILKSPNGSCWRITIDDSGNLVRTAITCP